MTVIELVLAIIVFMIAGVCLILGIRSFTERGFVLNNACIFASKEEREAMDKKPYYIQTAIVFCFLCIAFVIIGISIVLRDQRIELLEIPLFIALIIYVSVSTVRINKMVKK